MSPEEITHNADALIDEVRKLNSVDPHPEYEQAITHLVDVKVLMRAATSI